MDTATTSFYVTGGTLRQDAPSYVARRADIDLYDGLLRGEFCYVLTARQMGKSSLMVRTAARLRQEGVTVVILDLTAVGQNLSAEQWYDGLLAQLGEALDLEEELEAFWRAHPRLGPLQRWIAALRHVVLARVPGRVVIFVDEIDAVQSLPFSTDEFFAAIRECYNRRAEDPNLTRLAFCLLGVASPSDLIQDTRVTPFNIGRRIELTDFSEAEARPLAAGLLGEMDSTPASLEAQRTQRAQRRHQEEEAELLLQRVLYWTGGHPYLTQRLCRALAERPRTPPNSLLAFSVPSVFSVPLAKRVLNRSDPTVVDRLCEELFLSPKARERDDNLLFVRERLLRSDTDVAGLLDLYSRVRRRQKVRDDETRPMVLLLRLAGITRGVDGHLRVRNRIYERVFDRAWIAAHMPDAELRRQRAAFHRGLLRAAAVAVVVVAAMAGLTLFAIGQARRATEQALAARRNLYVADMNVAHQAWESGNVRRTQELLDRHQPRPGEEDLRGFEWRYLWRLCQENAPFWTVHGDRWAVRTVAFSPDGRVLASGGFDTDVKLWDVVHHRLLASLGTDAGVDRVTFSPDGKLLVAGTGRGLRLWEVATRRQIAILKGRTSAVSGVAFSPDGKTLASVTPDRTLCLWDVVARREIAVLQRYTEGSRAVAFSPDGTILAVSGEKHTAKLWNVVTGRTVATLNRHPDVVKAVAFSPDGRTLATLCNDDDIVRVWDTTTYRLRTTLPGHREVETVVFSPDGKKLAVGSCDTTVKVWDIATQGEVNTLKGHGNDVYAVAFSPDGRTLATGGEDETVRLWHVPARRATVLQRYGARVFSVSFSPDGKLLAAGGGGLAGDRHPGMVALWDVASEREVAHLNPPSASVRSIAFSPDGRLLAWAGEQEVRLWSLTTRRQMAPLGRGERVWTVAFAPGGQVLAADGERGVSLWDVRSGRRVALLPMPRGPGQFRYALAFSPDGRTLASGDRKNTITLWGVASRHAVATLRGHTRTVFGIAFSPDGKLLASGSDDNTARLWDVTKACAVAVLTGHTDAVVSLAFFPDGKTLASGGWDRTVKLWNVATAQEVATLTGPERGVYSVTVSPDGNALAIGGWDHTLRLWRAAPLAEIDAAGERRGVGVSIPRAKSEANRRPAPPAPQ